MQVVNAFRCSQQLPRQQSNLLPPFWNTCVQCPGSRQSGDCLLSESTSTHNTQDSAVIIKSFTRSWTPLSVLGHSHWVYLRSMITPLYSCFYFTWGVCLSSAGLKLCNHAKGIHSQTKFFLSFSIIFFIVSFTGSHVIQSGSGTTGDNACFCFSISKLTSHLLWLGQQETEADEADSDRFLQLHLH